jgi:hypothetical protein
MDPIESQYLLLALHLDEHCEGFVDGYHGPPELRAQVKAGGPRPLESLVEDAERLLPAIGESGFDPQRKDFLWRQTRAMSALARNLSGDRLAYLDEVEHYFDIRPERVPEAIFEAAHADLEQLLAGHGPLPGRMAAWNKSLQLAPDHMMPVFEMAREETRRRTLALFELPPGEGVALRLVNDQPWSAYNWYLGDYRSRIELNVDLPARGDWVVPLLAHEAYPGHHTEHALKEALLYRGRGWAEFGAQLLLAPECVLSEGIAESGCRIIFGDDELVAFLEGQLYPAAGLAHVDVEAQMGIQRARRQLRGVGENAALLLHQDGRPAEEVQRYVEHYGLNTPEEAAQTISFVQSPLFRSYVFNYRAGEAMLEPLLKGPHAVDVFRRLLTEPLTPTQVRGWPAAPSGDR